MTQNEARFLHWSLCRVTEICRHRLIFLHVLLCLSGVVRAFPKYADRIPNGRLIPNPGPQGGVWAGGGHEMTSGGGSLNEFGRQFMNAGYAWTQSLCRQDADRDGRTNGEELGDPDCIWRWGEIPTGPAVSHPGFADEPMVLFAGHSCDDYEDPVDVQYLDLSFSSPNKLNSSRTHYRCEQLTVETPESKFYHVRSDVRLDHTRALHHIRVYHCISDDSSDGNKVGAGPYECTGIEANCLLVGGWALGPLSQCEPPNVASSLDFRGSNVLKIEAHYDNSEGVVFIEDQSGMSLRLTTRRPPLESGLVTVGMDIWDRQFRIPAKKNATQLVNLCPTAATERLPHPVWVYSWNPHMHTRGTKLVTEVFRCGTKVAELGRIEDYEFNNQQTYILDPPVKILPGDALVTTCTYDSTDMDKDIVGGEHTTEEMCTNYLTYYPFAGNKAIPKRFSACSSFAEGLNPIHAGFDDSTPFASMSLGRRDVIVEDWEFDPTKNVATCCELDSCEERFLSPKGSPCGVADDCKGSLVCKSGLCEKARLGMGHPVKSASCHYRRFGTVSFFVFAIMFANSGR